MKTVDIDEDSWTEIMKKANKGKWDFPLTLSCNQYHDAWYSTTYGLTPKEDRVPISLEEYPYIKEILSELLIIEPAGGRFHIDKVSAKFAKDRSTICYINFI